jgi:hypothetical protein
MNGDKWVACALEMREMTVGDPKGADTPIVQNNVIPEIFQCCLNILCLLPEVLIYYVFTKKRFIL